MAEPALDQVRWHVGLEGVHAESMAQALGHGGRPGDVGRRHDGLDVSPRRRTAPVPQTLKGKLGIALATAKLENAIQFVEHILRQWYLPNDAALAALESLDA